MGDKKNTYIELNGIRYDAHSGKVLEQPSEIALDKPLAPPKPVMPVTIATGGGAIDGFSRRPATRPSVAALQQKAVPRTPKPQHSQPQKSKTLMRPAVNKPKITKQPLSAKETKDIQKSLISNEHAARIRRAQTAKKSSIISRFYPGGTSPSITKRVDSLPVATPPKANAHTAKVNAVSAVAEPSAQISNRFEQAIQGATSHLNVHHAKRKKPKRLTIVSSALSVALLAGFFAYQNVPLVQMKVAATRAGFSADLPGYSPAGFGVSGSIRSEPGKVSVTFKSRTDDKSFQLKQQVSEWSSTALLTNYVETKTDLQPISFQDERGRTLYRYNDSNITWVDGGVWYDIEGNASLTDDQLLRIANSL